MGAEFHALPSHTTHPTQPRFTPQDARGSLGRKSFCALCQWGLHLVSSPSLHPEGQGLRLKLATL